MNPTHIKTNPNTAKVGDTILFDDYKKGLVIKVLNNTVIADISLMEGYDFHLMGHERQVVHHTKYEVISSAEQNQTND